MRYNQPYDQPTSPNAPFVNGDPSSSQPGSIPPAAALEYPQREIVGVIAAAGLAPDNADLAQMLRAIRGGQLFTFTDQSGSANAIVISPGVAHTSIAKCLPFRIFPANSNTGASVTLQVNTLTAPLVRHDGSPLVAGDVVAGVPFDCVSDGASVRILGFTASDIESIVLATSPSSGYVQIGDQNYSVASGNRVVATSVPLTAPRTLTLPLASSRSAGDTLVFMDRVGAVGATGTLTFAASGSDKTDGSASYTIAVPYKTVTFRSDGVSTWTYDKPSAASGNIVTGSGVSVAGDLPAFADTTGIHLVDSGFSVQAAKFAFCASILF